MYYDNGSYMQDLNYYNQNPVQNWGYNPYMMNNQQFQIGMQNQQNLNAMYPASYRIICPVAKQVVNNSNTQYITEESLNNMVDTVYNIVEGDINLSENSRSSNQNSNETSAENTQTNNRNSSSSNSSTSATSNANCRTNRQNALLRDLIKIIILNEIVSKRQNQTVMMQNFNMNQQMF